MARCQYQTGWVYALLDPRSVLADDLSEIRYVGYSFNPTKRRLAHLREARNGGKGHRCNWIRQLLKNGIEPVVWLLEEAQYIDLPRLEISWIADLRQCYKLVNDTDGGDGAMGYTGPRNISEEGRQRQREGARRARNREIAEGKTLPIHTPEVRKKVGEMLKGFEHSEKSKKAFSEGAKKRFEDPIERKKISDATKGLAKSEEHKKKLAEAARRQQARAVKSPCPTCGVMMIPTALGMHRKCKGH